MTNWTQLKAAIANVIKTNSNQEITGDILQNTLNSIVNAVGENATFAGVATPSTNPGEYDGPVFYVAYAPGTYVNFNSYELISGIAMFINIDSNWQSLELPVVSKEELQAAEYDLFGNLFSIEATAIRQNGAATSTAPGINATEFLPITKGSDIAIKGGWNSRSSSIVAFAFYDSNKAVISTSANVSPATGLVNTTILKDDIPTNATYIRCTTNILKDAKPYIKGTLSISSVFSEIATAVDNSELQAANYALLNSLGLASYNSANTITGTEEGGYMRDNGTLLISSDYVHTIYDIEANKKYRVVIPPYAQSSTITLLQIKDTTGTIIASLLPLAAPGKKSIDAVILTPPNASQLIINWRRTTGAPPSVQNATISIDNIGLAFKNNELEIAPVISDTTGYFITDTGSPKQNASFHYTKFDVSDKSKQYLISTGIGSSTKLYAAHYYDNAGIWLGAEHYMTDGPVQLTDAVLHIPERATHIYVNANNANSPVLKQVALGDFYNLQQLSGAAYKLMKVHVYNTEPDVGSDAFYIRTAYSSTKDIIIKYYINYNTLLSPCSAYVGDKSLADEQLMAAAYCVSTHSDSTAPLFNSSVYWHLFAQHGYVIPRINNTACMSSADIGAVWKDQLDREYTVGAVTDSYISLLPTIIKGTTEGADTRGWKTPNSEAIITLSHVSGGSYTSTFTVQAAGTVQLRPIMAHSNRKWLADGLKIAESGDYYCDEFKVSESQVGYDPASIKTWFPTPILSGALEMARFTWSYNFVGPNCAVNTTIAIMRKVECQSYGACQQQFFLDNGNYKAMFLIPKLKPISGIDPSKPFNSSSTSSTGFTYQRNSTYLIDENDPVDRQIGYLYNAGTNDYLVGMAAGLSLVSGDTVREKRIKNIPIGQGDAHERLGSFSPANTNKFYIAAINTAQFSEDEYNLPNTYFKEINYYVSYFNPAENKGQVYWYKDGNSYIIYAHCQNKYDRLAINLPDFMEGLNVEVVERTDGASLLTSTIQNNTLFVSYSSAANYIVLKTT